MWGWGWVHREWVGLWGFNFSWFILFQAPSDHENLMSAKWGKLSCSILAQDWDSALEELNKLKRDIDETVRGTV